MGYEIVYQFQYEICALVFLVALTAHFFGSRRFPQPTNTMFIVVLIAALVDIILDLLGCFTISVIDYIPTWITFVTNSVFYCLQVFMPVMMSSYFIYAAGESYRKKPMYLLILIPSALFMVTQLVNPVTGWIFSIRHIDGHNVYTYGSLHPGIYICAGFYLLATLVLIISHRKKLTSRQCTMGLLFIAIVILAVTIQFIFPALLLTGTAITVSIMLMMFTVQNPDDMIDSISGTFNFSAFSMFLAHAIENNHRLNLIAIEIDGADTSAGRTTPASEIRTFSDIGRFLNSLSNTNWVFRLGNNRFIISVRDARDMNAMSQKISERFGKPWRSENCDIDLVSTIINFTTPSKQFTQTELISFIEESIGSESTEYGKCIHVEVGESFLASISRRNAIVMSLNKALTTGQGLELHYQPLCRAKDRTLAGAEALLRFNDPWLGFVSPAEFIPIAEKSGLAPKIDSFVLTKACEFLKTHPALKLLDVNLSGASFFTNPAQSLIRIVELNEIDPHRICFEITETAAAMHPEILKDFVMQMSDRGFTFALDDFGTGYANINQLTDMPFSTIKLDRSLIQEGVRKKELVASLLSMFNSMGFTSVAEGVETEEQYERMCKQGAGLIQGFLYSKPLPEIAFSEFMNRARL